MSENSQTKFKRVILKISGEILGSREEGEPIFAESLERVCSEIKAVADLGAEVGLVVGGGNIFRGLRGAKKGIDRTTGDSMGMLATVINGLALMDCLEKMGAVVRVQTAIPMEKLAEFVKENLVQMAIICVPPEEAQEVANDLVESGVTGIMNFAPTVLQVPDDVTVNNVNMAIELENLSYFVQQ